MNKTKIYFCLFLLLVSFIYLYTKIRTVNLFTHTVGRGFGLVCLIHVVLTEVSWGYLAEGQVDTTLLYLCVWLLGDVWKAGCTGSLLV